MDAHDIDSLDQAAYETVHDFVDSNTGKKGAIGVANITGMRPSTVQNKASRTDFLANFNIKEMRTVMLATNDFRMLETMNRDCGFAMTALPTLDRFSSDMDLLSEWADWQSEVAKTGQRIKEALSDGKITQAEVAEIRKEVVKDYKEALEMACVLEDMAEPEDNVAHFKKAD